MIHGRLPVASSLLVASNNISLILLITSCIATFIDFRLLIHKMAEVIQGILEDMLPDLLDFLTRDIFNDSEIKQIIKTRREFEYKLMRPQPLKRHFLAAVQYELSLEDQRVRRRNELGINKPSNSDRSSNLYFSSSSRG
jgi:hypothetical protein